MFHELLKVLLKPAKFDKKEDNSSSSSKSTEGMINDKIMAKPQDLGFGYDAGSKDEQEAGPVIRGGEDPDPITRYARYSEKCN